MWRIMVSVLLAAMLGLAAVGCKKEPAGSEEVKTMEEYQTEAEQEITEENMDEELQQIESSIEQETSQETGG